MMGKLSAVIWDWNGTLLNDVRENHQIINRMLANRALPPVDLAMYRRFFRMPIRDFYRDIGFSFETESFESVAAEYFALYEERFAQMSVTDGIPETLARLAASGVDQYIVSAAQQADLSRYVRAKGLDGFFRRIVGNDDRSVVSKVDKALELRRSLGVGDVLVIGDMYHDYEVARAIGAKCVLYSGGHQLIDASADYGRIDAMAELQALIG